MKIKVKFNKDASQVRSLEAFSGRAWSVLLIAGCAFVASCDSGGDGDDDPASGSETRFVTSTIVFDDDGETTYVSLLPDLDTTAVDLGVSHEIPGWAGIWANEGRLYVADGESPTMTRYAIGDDGTYTDQGRISFMNVGVQYADSVFVSADQAYVFGDDVTVWSPETMTITGSFPIPVVEDLADGLEYSGLSTGRGVVLRGHRLYVATNWANWEAYAVAEQSAIVVIDTETNQVVDTLAVPCPYVDVASIDDDGSLYFSNWVYSIPSTLLHGKKKACAVRIPAGQETIDTDWTLTFADVTDGREAAALRFIGDGKALISVFYDENVDLVGADPSTVADTANWRFWTLDLTTREASPVDGIGVHSGGFAAARVDDHNIILVPSADYATTTAYELFSDGTIEERWTTIGWSTQLLRLR